MQTKFGACFVTDTGLFQNLDKKVLQKIATNSKVYKFGRKDKKTIEFPIEKKVYIIHQGCVFLSYIDENGKKIILDILAKGDIFGDLNFTSKREIPNESLFIEPFTNASVCEIKKEYFKEILKENPEFTISLLSNISNRLLLLGQKLGVMAFSNVEARLLAQMIELSKNHGSENDSILRVGLQVTHEKLAEMIGAARETVSETISDLRKRKILSQDNKKKFILHKDKINSLFSN